MQSVGFIFFAHIQNNAMASLEKLMDATLWENALYTAMGFFAPDIVEIGVERFSGNEVDLPPEAYSVGGMAFSAFFLKGRMARYMLVGSASNAILDVSDRFGVLEGITDALRGA